MIVFQNYIVLLECTPSCAAFVAMENLFGLLPIMQLSYFNIYGHFAQGPV